METAAKTPPGNGRCGASFIKNMQQLNLLNDKSGKKYRPVISANENEKGVLDVDSVKGCSDGMGRYGDRGCYGECYARKIAARYGTSFQSVSRELTPKASKAVFIAVQDFKASWYRIGTAGDPSYDWELTVRVCEYLKPTGKIPVIITKHWSELGAQLAFRLAECRAVVNTSISALDSDSDRQWRLDQFLAMRSFGIKSVLRVVTCEFGDTSEGNRMRAVQGLLLSYSPVIDNPLRATKENPLVLNGTVLLKRREDAVGGGKLVSLHDERVYLGRCDRCPDQCGVTM